MAFFALPYRVLFHDTMAYGSHHHATNIKFQNIARETLLFESGADWKAQLDPLVLLTRDAYSLNLAPVQVGEKVGILTTYEDPSRSTVRLCFRVVSESGQPVACGYQTVLVMDRKGQHLVPAPPLMTQFLDPAKPFSLLEASATPSFVESVHAGSAVVRRIFPEAVLALGHAVATAPRTAAYPKIIDTALTEYPF